MPPVSRSFNVSTKSRVEIVNLTESLVRLVEESGVEDGFLHVHCMHTTAGLLVNEHQAALMHDFTGFIERFVDDGRGYRHNDPAYSDCDRGNAASHLRSLLLQPTLVLAIDDGQLQLGRYQRVLLTELDGPRERTVIARAAVGHGASGWTGQPAPRPVSVGAGG